MITTKTGLRTRYIRRDSQEDIHQQAAMRNGRYAKAVPLVRIARPMAAPKPKLLDQTGWSFHCSAKYTDTTIQNAGTAGFLGPETSRMASGLVAPNIAACTWPPPPAPTCPTVTA